MLTRPATNLSSETGDYQRVCPNCSLALTIKASRDGATVSYDMKTWAESCSSAATRDGPLSCPWVKRYVGAWLTSSR